MAYWPRFFRKNSGKLPTPKTKPKTTHPHPTRKTKIPKPNPSTQVRTSGNFFPTPQQPKPQNTKQPPRTRLEPQSTKRACESHWRRVWYLEPKWLRWTLYSIARCHRSRLSQYNIRIKLNFKLRTGRVFRGSTLAHQKVYPPLSQRDRNEFDRLDPNTRNIDNPPEELEFPTQTAHSNSTVRAVRARFAKVTRKCTLHSKFFFSSTFGTRYSAANPKSVPKVQSLPSFEPAEQKWVSPTWPKHTENR